MKINLKKYANSFKSRAGNTMKRLGAKVTELKKRIGVKKNTVAKQIGAKVITKPQQTSVESPFAHMAKDRKGIDVKRGNESKGTSVKIREEPKKQELITLKPPSLPSASTFTQLKRAATIIPQKKNELVGIAKRRGDGLSGSIAKVQSMRKAVKDTQHQIAAPS